jgi:serine/threonine protein kinase
LSNVISIHRKKHGLAPGHIFLDRYQLLKRLGSGGMGEVWAAKDLRQPRTVAIKVLYPEVLSTPGSVERFLRETLSLTRLNHHNVVHLYDSGMLPVPFMVMECVVGLTLRQKQRASEGHRIGWGLLVCYAIQIADGLGVIHRMDIWHRDIKPENLMVNEDGLVKILDFGIVRDAREERRRGSPTRSARWGTCRRRWSSSAPRTTAAICTRSGWCSTSFSRGRSRTA